MSRMELRHCFTDIIRWKRMSGHNISNAAACVKNGTETLGNIVR